MFELFETLVDWVSSLLAWLSDKQVQAAKTRITNMRKAIREIKHTQNCFNAKCEEKIIDAENEVMRMQYFLDQEYKEL